MRKASLSLTTAFLVAVTVLFASSVFAHGATIDPNGLLSHQGSIIDPNGDLDYHGATIDPNG